MSDAIAFIRTLILLDPVARCASDAEVLAHAHEPNGPLYSLRIGEAIAQFPDLNGRLALAVIERLRTARRPLELVAASSRLLPAIAITANAIGTPMATLLVFGEWPRLHYEYNGSPRPGCYHLAVSTTEEVANAVRVMNYLTWEVDEMLLLYNPGDDTVERVRHEIEAARHQRREIPPPHVSFLLTRADLAAALSMRQEERRAGTQARA